MARDPSSPGLPASSSSGWWCGPAGALHGSGDSSRDTVGAVAALDGSETAGNDDELITGRVENSPVSGAEVNDLGARIATDSSRRASSVGSTSGNCSGAGATASVAWPSTAAAPGSENRILGASARCTTAATCARRDSIGRGATVNSGPPDIVCGTTGLARPSTCPLGPAGSTWCANGARKLGLRAVASELVNESRGATGSVAVSTGRIGGRSSHAARWTGAGAEGDAAAACDGAGSEPPRLHQA